MSEFPYKYWCGSEEKEGYSGVAMLCKTEPLGVTYGIGEEAAASRFRPIPEFAVLRIDVCRFLDFCSSCIFKGDILCHRV